MSDCTCYTCIHAREIKERIPLFERETVTRMIVCDTCGNKRCPHGTNHELTCTNSNEPGQPGSRYLTGTSPTLSDKTREIILEALGIMLEQLDGEKMAVNYGNFIGLQRIQDEEQTVRVARDEFTAMFPVKKS